MKLPPYPRTLHLGDSGGGVSKHHCPFAEVAGHYLVIEEKVDGSHCGLGFDDDARLRILSRNTILESPPRRPDFQLLHELAEQELDGLWDVLGQRFVLYGEWARVAHTIYYDALPTFFLEDDIFDRQAGKFLSTSRRAELTDRLPESFRRSVAVLDTGSVSELAHLHELVGPSRYKSSRWRERCPDHSGIEDCDLMEGLYIKQEDPDFVLQRLKWVRPSFLEHIAAADAHWRSRAPVHNLLG